MKLLGLKMPPEKRTWVYVMEPAMYGLPDHSCGETPQWSDLVHQLWCPKCMVDFIPEHNGIFDGPIGANLCSILGITFDRFNLLTEEVELFPDYMYAMSKHEYQDHRGEPLT